MEGNRLRRAGERWICVANDPYIARGNGIYAGKRAEVGYGRQAGHLLPG